MKIGASPSLPTSGAISERGAFALEIDALDADTLNLLVSPPGSRSTPTVIWSCCLETPEDRTAVLDAIYKNGLDLDFVGHLTMNFGDAEIEAIVDRIVTQARDARREAAEQAAELARKHEIVHLYAPDKKRGYLLELQRKSRDTADWTVVYDRASERDRLCDWLRWQNSRFLDFLNYAAKHGDEALTRVLTDEMFTTERRVKKEGRGAGGARPLRMWRGD